MHSEFTQVMLPTFLAIDPAHIVPELKKILSENQEYITQLLAQDIYSWENLMQPLEELEDKLDQYWAPIAHMHGVMETDVFRKAYNEALTLLTTYHTEISQNKKLFSAISAIAEGRAFPALSPAQQKIIQNDVRDFKLSGIHLSKKKKAQLAILQQHLSQAMTQFSENLLDATQSWFLHITEIERLHGLPMQALQLAIQNARARKLDGYVLTLDFPSYSTALKFLDDREIRRTLYKAYTTRASDQSDPVNQWNNTPVMEEILQIRHEIAQLVGFKNYAEYSLATKMAKSTDEVLSFLHNLLEKSIPFAKAEYAEIAALAKKTDQIDSLNVWDLSYYSEKLSEAKFKFTQEELRPYFPINKVLQGLFETVHLLYGLTIRKQSDIEVWHPDVLFYAIYDQQNKLRGGLYIDLYSRTGKRDGAWMDECRTRRILPNNEIQLPVAFLTCNFMPPVNQQPALLTHDDVITLFHEFGHCLHHLLTQVDHPAVGGINGVAWDAVEFPSQFMENFCWEEKTIESIAAHYETGAPLPKTLYQKMLAAKKFETGLQMIRQIEFALFDFRVHIEWDTTKPKLIQSILDEVRKLAAVIAVPEFNRFQHSFSHIFAGSYGAGYYSYTWAEVLSADAYEKFQEHGVFDQATGKSFMKNILEIGGVCDPLAAFAAFRGRQPSIDALLKQNGMTS